MKVNSLCGMCELEHKNSIISQEPNGIQQFLQFYEKVKYKKYRSAIENIVNKKVKVEDGNILNGFKEECENRFIKSTNENKCISQHFKIQIQNGNEKKI